MTSITLGFDAIELGAEVYPLNNFEEKQCLKKLHQGKLIADWEPAQLRPLAVLHINRVTSMFAAKSTVLSNFVSSGSMNPYLHVARYSIDIENYTCMETDSKVQYFPDLSNT